jgi:hypothetical protein
VQPSHTTKSHRKFDFATVRFAPILLKKSKIEPRLKSREALFLAVSTAATLLSADTEVGGNFCKRRCGPSRRRVRNASAVLKNFGRHPKKTFSTLSARSRRSRSLWTKPQTSSEKVKTFLPASDARRATAIEVLGYSNVGHPGLRHP